MKSVPFAVRTFVVAFQDSSPADPLHVYDDDGVRSTTVGMLLLRLATLGVVADPWSVSNVGGVPLDCRHGKYGPGFELRYHASQSTVGADEVPGLLVMLLAQTLSNPLEPAPCWQGLCSALFFHLHPLRTPSWLSGVVDVPA